MRVGSTSISANPASPRRRRYSSSASAPATHPTHSSILRRTALGISPRHTTSETARRPPGFSTRNASCNTRPLSADKGRVLQEAFRVLKPGGRLAVSDVVCRGEIPSAVRRNMELWVGCVAGALAEDEYRRLLGDAGFAEIDVEPTRI